MKKTSAYLFAAFSFALGLWAFHQTQEVAGPDLNSTYEACTSVVNSNGTTALSDSSLHPFEPKTGLVVFGPSVCFITQFLFDLTQQCPVGLLVWLAMMAAMQPVSVLVTVEAGRGGAKGPIRYPTLMLLLFQFIGSGIIFPAIWIPAYLLGRGDGAVSEMRARVAVPLALPVPILSMLVFWLDTDSYAWQLCCGILGGPLLASLPILLWSLRAPKASSQRAIDKGAEATRKAYQNASIVAIGIWWYILYVVWSSYCGYSRGGEFVDAMNAIWSDLWAEAHHAVAFLLIDAFAVWASMLLFIGFHDITNAVTALLLTPLLGPGASCCIVMSEMGTERLPASTTKTKQE